MRKTTAAAAMAASLTVGGAAGAVLFAPDVVSAQSDETTTTEPAERGQYLEDALAPLVEDGTIDQSQADAVIEALKDARPTDHRFGPGHRMPLDGALLDTLGITAEELRTAIADGQTIAEIAEANGVSVDDVVAAIVAEATERIDAAVEDGRLTEDEAADKTAEAQQRAEDFVNGEFDFEFGERRGGHGHGPTGDAPDASAPDDSGSADDSTGS